MKVSNWDQEEKIINDSIIRRDLIEGANTWGNYIWALVLALGGLGFFSAGLSSYFKTNFLPFLNSSELIFLPQGILLLFYGTLAIFLSLILLIWSSEKIGSGFNEYDKQENVVRIFRKGFSFFNNDIYLVYPFRDITNIELEIIDNIVPRRVLYLCLKDNRKIPLTPSNILMDLGEIEKKGIVLADFIGVTLLLNKV